MEGEVIMGAVIMAVCCFGCAALFLGLGVHMQKTGKPAHFWAGSEVKPEWITDIPKYNNDNGRMWICYSIPYFLAGILGCLNWIHERFIIASVTVLLAAAFPGIYFLIRQYRKIEKKYIDPKKLDKIDPFC